jgi:Transposase DDE domain group 1
VLLRPGKTPSGIEILAVTCGAWSVASAGWPQTRITIRGDGHYGRPEVMGWCDENGIDFIFGLPGNAVLDRDYWSSINTNTSASHRKPRKGW